MGSCIARITLTPRRDDDSDTALFFEPCTACAFVVARARGRILASVITGRCTVRYDHFLAICIRGAGVCGGSVTHLEGALGAERLLSAHARAAAAEGSGGAEPKRLALGHHLCAK
jgi:hypothetical protein